PDGPIVAGFVVRQLVPLLLTRAEEIDPGTPVASGRKQKVGIVRLPHRTLLSRDGGHAKQDQRERDSESHRLPLKWLTLDYLDKTIFTPRSKMYRRLWG